jgi:hypothetical protein
MPAFPLSLASSENLSQTQRNETGGGTGGSGFRSSIVNNFSQGGASLSSGLSEASSSLPLWVIFAAAGAAGLGLWWALRKGNS